MNKIYKSVVFSRSQLRLLLLLHMFDKYIGIANWHTEYRRARKAGKKISIGNSVFVSETSEVIIIFDSISNQTSRMCTL